MNSLLKLFSALILGIAVVLVTQSHLFVRETTVRQSQLSAAVGTILQFENGPFDAEGTIVIDSQTGAHGSAFLLYTAQNTTGRPEILTKRLVFKGKAECVTAGLPCASPQGGIPVQHDERVRIIGTVVGERVDVDYWQRL